MRLRFWKRKPVPRPRPPRAWDLDARPSPAGGGVGTEAYLIDKVARGEMTVPEFVKLSRQKADEVMARRGQIRREVRPGESPTGKAPPV